MMNRDFLKTLLNTVSVSGNEEANQENILAYTKDFADCQETDAVGNVIITVNPQEGETRQRSDGGCCSADIPASVDASFARRPKVLLGGHIDEIGFRVTHITDSGLVRIQHAGGVRPRLYVGCPMQIIHETEENGTLVRKKVEGVSVVTDDILKNADLKDKDLQLDIGASSKEEAAAVVSPGDSVCADTTVHELLGDHFSCRALDDKTGAFVIIEAVRQAKEKGAACTIFANTTVGEETSGRGAWFAGTAVRPDCAVLVDVTWASDCPGTDPGETGQVKLGGGPVLCRSGMVNKQMNRLLEQIAAEKQIPVQYEVAGSNTYTDGDTVLQTGSGVPMALVSIPLRYMHSSVEVANWKDLENCIELISEFLMRITADFDYRPVKA